MSDYLGRAVVDGVPQYTSVSALEKFDPRSNGCNLAWWYRYVRGLKEPESASMAAGSALHLEIEKYLKTGDKMLSALALSGMHMIPEPGPDLLVEHRIDGHVTADGIPLVGKVDCSHERELNKGGEDVEDQRNPPGTREVIDWKWKRDGSRTEFYADRSELVNTIQMAGYGVWVARAFPSTRYVRLSHGYFPATRGRPRKVTKLHVIDDPLRTWEYVDALGRSVRHVAREVDPGKVEGNLHACQKYGGCPYRDSCPAYKNATQTKSIESHFGQTLGREVKAAMGLLTTLPPVTPAPDIKKQLAEEEAKLRQQATQQSLGILPGFEAACAAIQKSEYGFPALTGKAVVMLAALGGQSVDPNATWPGRGRLGALTLDDPQAIVGLGEEIAAELAAKAPPQVKVEPKVTHVQHNAAPAAVLPPDAPASIPAIAAKPVEGFTPAPGNPTQVAWAAAQNTTAAPPSSYATVVVPPPAQQVAAAAPKKRGRPKSEPAAVAAPAPTSPVGQGAPQAAAPGEELEVYVNCVPNCETRSLRAYADGILGKLMDKFIPAGGLRDVRLAPKDGPLGFGGWRGAICAIVQEIPPPAGRWSLDTRDNEVMSEVANALASLCERTGALYVRGA